MLRSVEEGKGMWGGGESVKRGGGSVRRGAGKWAGVSEGGGTGLVGLIGFF